MAALFCPECKGEPPQARLLDNGTYQCTAHPTARIGRPGEDRAAVALPKEVSASLDKLALTLRHTVLHAMLDELLADFLAHNPKALPSTTTVIELAEWSQRQMTNPED